MYEWNFDFVTKLMIFYHNFSSAENLLIFVLAELYIKEKRHLFGDVFGRFKFLLKSLIFCF